MKLDETEQRRSAVRRRVTYGTIATYLVLSFITVIWLLFKENYDMAIAVLGAVGGMAGSITGFWFGARRPNEHATSAESNQIKPNSENGNES